MQGAVGYTENAESYPKTSVFDRRPRQPRKKRHRMDGATVTLWGSSQECEDARRMLTKWDIIKDLAEIGRRTGVSFDLDVYTEEEGE